METRNQEIPVQGKLPTVNLWSAETRRWVVIAVVLAGVWLLYQLGEILPPIITALLLAYLLSPLVAFLQRRRGMPRILAVASIYLTLIAILVGASILLTPVLIREVRSLCRELDRILALIMQSGQVSLPGFPQFTVE